MPAFSNRIPHTSVHTSSNRQAGVDPAKLLRPIRPELERECSHRCTGGDAAEFTQCHAIVSIIAIRTNGVVEVGRSLVCFDTCGFAVMLRELLLRACMVGLSQVVGQVHIVAAEVLIGTLRLLSVNSIVPAMQARALAASKARYSTQDGVMFLTVYSSSPHQSAQP